MRKVFSLTLILATLSLMSSCKKTSGEKAETSDAAEVTEAKGTSYNVDLANSTIMWEGTKPTGSHNGTIDLSSGSLIVEGDKLAGGSFEIDMNTIKDLDLPDDKRPKLEGHLKGTNEGQEDDFFNVKKFPTAKFEITKVSALQNDENANTLIYGNLTLRDVTKQIGFKANVNIADGSITAATPQFTIDRAEFGVKYGSQKFFDNLKDNVINDEIGLTIKLQAKG